MNIAGGVQDGGQLVRPKNINFMFTEGCSISHPSVGGLQAWGLSICGYSGGSVIISGAYPPPLRILRGKDVNHLDCVIGHVGRKSIKILCD